MFERFTRRARTVVETASAYAAATRSRETRPEHLFRGLLADEDCLATRVLVQSGTTVEELRAERRVSERRPELRVVESGRAAPGRGLAQRT